MKKQQSQWIAKKLNGEKDKTQAGGSVSSTALSKCLSAKSGAILRRKEVARIRCRGELRSPVAQNLQQIQNCRGATQFLFHRNGRPVRRSNAVVVVSLMLNYVGGIVVIFSVNSTGEV